MPSQKKAPVRLRTKQFEGKITQRGKQRQTEKKESSPLGPWVLGFFIFVVVGSALFQIIRTASRI